MKKKHRKYTYKDLIQKIKEFEDTLSVLRYVVEYNRNMLLQTGYALGCYIEMNKDNKKFDKFLKEKEKEREAEKEKEQPDTKTG